MSGTVNRLVSRHGQGERLAVAGHNLASVEAVEPKARCRRDDSATFKCGAAF